MRSQPSSPRSRTRGQRTATGPMPVMISRSGRCPWRTNRRRPSSVSLSAWQLSKLETSASTACARRARAPLRKTSVSGSVKVPGCESWKTLVSVTAYHSFAGEVEASNTPTIRRLTPSRRHQLSPIALAAVKRWRWASRSRKCTRRPHDGGAKTRRDEHRGDVGAALRERPYLALLSKSTHDFLVPIEPVSSWCLVSRSQYKSGGEALNTIREKRRCNISTLAESPKCGLSRRRWS
jgi:hypothetical protein